MQSNHIPIYTSEDFEGMRKAGSLASKILDQLREIIKPGISTQEINDYCKKMKKILITASINKFNGQLFKFDFKKDLFKESGCNKPKYRKHIISLCFKTQRCCH